MAQRILIVDDEPDLVRILQILLQAQGYETDQAPDAPTALRKVSQHAPDLILLDVMLPGMSGLEMCRMLKGEAATRDMRVMLLTARADQDDSFREVGADDCVLKPFAIDRLLERIQSLLAA